MEQRAIRLAEESDFELGRLSVRPSACQILRSDGAHRVEPRVMQVLVSLARRRGETVSRETLLEECWGGTAVGDDALVRSVSQLRKALGNGASGVSVATVPKVGYRLLVSRNGAPGPSTFPRWLGAALFLAAALALALALALSFRSSDRNASTYAPPLGPMAFPLTSLPGLEQWPAFSPSGGQVAYSFRRAPGESTDIYVKSVGADSALRLTDTAADELHPVWSPDGGTLAFVRQSSTGCSIHTVSPFGGSEARSASCGRAQVIAFDWSPAGDRWIYSARESATAPGRAFLVDVATGTQTPVLVPETPTSSVEEVAFAPDGRRIGFTLSTALGVEDLYVHDPSTGKTHRVTHDSLKIHGFDWLPDGSGFVLSSNRGGEFALWRVDHEGGELAPLPGAVGGADEPDVSESGRIVYEAWRHRAGIWRAKLPGLSELTPLVVSTRFDWDGHLSPDRGRITFVSDRSGSAEVWIAAANGETPKKLTSFGGPYTHTPRFSPDGGKVALAAPVSGNFDLYLADVESGALEKLTTDPGDDFAPSWAPGGESLFFGSTRSGDWQIWRLDLETRKASPVTRNGGRAAQVSPDGAHLYFVKADRGGLWRLDLTVEAAAEEEILEVLEPVDWNNWQVLERAIYFVRRPEPSRPELVRHDLSSKKSESLGLLPELLYKSGLFVPPDESAIVFTRVESVEADLMILEGSAVSASIGARD